jgi:hypothetical protein
MKFFKFNKTTLQKENPIFDLIEKKNRYTPLVSAALKARSIA